MKTEYNMHLAKANRIQYENVYTGEIKEETVIGCEWRKILEFALDNIPDEYRLIGIRLTSDSEDFIPVVF